MQEYPVRFERLVGGKLLIEWSDGERLTYSYGQLQANCPCASCREKRQQPVAAGGLLPVIRPEEAQPLELVRMEPVGNYAYRIIFNHGCDSGIYTLEFLRELGQVSGNAAS